MTLAMPKHHYPTNTLKKWVGALLNGGGVSKPVALSFNPASAPSDPLAKFLLAKTEYQVYEVDSIVLATKDRFLDDTVVTGKEFAKKLTAVIPSIADPTGKVIGMDVLSITCSKL